ncbi:MAG: hypothetical protein ACI9WU_003796 [Myxococcota bacterium]|jgi:hypothetical protein
MKGLRIVLGILCAYHVGIGLISVASTELTAEFAHWFYGTESLRVDAQLIYSLKALGMYALFTASVIALPLRSPRRFLPVVYCVVFLQSMRAVSRLVFFDVLHDGLGVSWSQNIFNVGLLLVEVGLLVLFARGVEADKTGECPPEPS